MAKNVPPAPAEKEQAEGSRQIVDHELKNQDRKDRSGGKSQSGGTPGKTG